MRALVLCTLLTTEAMAAPSVAVWSGQVVSIDADGQVGAWRLADRSFDERLALKLGSRPLKAIASDGTALWACTAGLVLEWSDATDTWLERRTLPTPPELVERLVVTPEVVALVYATHVYEARRGKSFGVPQLEGQVKGNALRVLDAFAQGSRVWIGSGFGEWGGHLMGLDVETGAWVQRYDGLHYVTGITGDGATLTVSWAMSHFDASTVLRLYDAAGKETSAFPELKGKYFQKLARAGDGTLYGIEQQSLVVVKDGQPTKPVSLGNVRYGAERNAVGVAPGIVALKVLDDGLLVMPEKGPLLMVQGAKVAPLESKPAPKQSKK